ncbi:MAG: hypothetical protein IJE70_00260 [Oscillospiraceae bacterium]|nr:hypothetical protein [Oscillospiraceae bacterium]
MANDDAPLMMYPSEMMSASPDIIGKHHYAKAIHHIAIGDTSLKGFDFCDIIIKAKRFRRKKQIFGTAM